MKIESTFLRSRVARRIFSLFLISAIFPVGLLAFFSYEQINSLTSDTVSQYLRRDAKRYGGELYTRLGILESELEQVASEDMTHLYQQTKRFSHYFSGLGTINGTVIDMHWGKKPVDIRRLSDSETSFLASGKNLLLTHKNQLDIYLLHPILGTKGGQPSLLVAHINPDFLWGIREDFDLHFGFCVFSDGLMPLFCSKPKLGQAIQSALFNDHQAISLQKENSLFINTWDLYLKGHFFAPKWKVVFTQIKQEALAPLSAFKTIFSGVILFSLLVVAYISVYLIRINMKPLESLMEGIQHISNDEFDQPVPVLSRDEFGLLASSFNSMSARISKQLSVLTALAEIDRLILTRLKKEDILRVIMNRTHQIIASDFISIALRGKDNEQNFYLYTSEGLDDIECYFSQDELNKLNTSELFEITDFQQQETTCLAAMVQKGAKQCLVLPIRGNDKLAAILSLGFLKPIDLSGTEREWVRDYGGRIAVALANASWEETLYYQAHYDVLTGLPNRQLLNDRLQQALTQTGRDHAALAIFAIDLDRFKSVNDSLGHTAGDRLLKEIAHRINDHLQQGNTVARMGGDEFIVILPNIHRGIFSSAYIAGIAQQLLDCIAEPLLLEGHEVRVTASMGIVISPSDGQEIETLIKNADAAMYHAKDKGKGNYQFYSEKLNSSTLKRLLLESDLIGALDGHEFELYYQPKVNAATGKITGAEALIRWNHPEQGLVSPNQFIPVVEETNMVISIGEWVLRTACIQNKQWQTQGNKAIVMAVNVAAKQLLYPGFVASVQAAFEEAHLEPCWLELEVTESATLGDMDRMITVLNELKELGVNLSIDDYGTGYSSLQYLKDLPVDVLKIDQSFIFNLLEVPKNVAIVQSTIALAHNFGLKVIAEGVETKEHQEYLHELGCDELQGYLFSRPVPAQDFIRLLQALT